MIWTFAVGKRIVSIEPPETFHVADNGKTYIFGGVGNTYRLNDLAAKNIPYQT
jgi:hypothetical protein